MKNKFKILILLIFITFAVFALTACPDSRCRGPEGNGVFDAPIALSFDENTNILSWDKVYMECECERTNYCIYVKAPEETEYTMLTETHTQEYNISTAFSHLDSKAAKLGTYEFAISTLAHGRWTESELSQETISIAVTDISLITFTPTYNVILESKSHIYLLFDSPHAFEFSIGTGFYPTSYSNRYYDITNEEKDINTLYFTFWSEDFYKEEEYTFVIEPRYSFSFEEGHLYILNDFYKTFTLSVSKSDSVFNDKATGFKRNVYELFWNDDTSCLFSIVKNTNSTEVSWISSDPYANSDEPSKYRIIKVGGFLSTEITGENSFNIVLYGDGEEVTCNFKKLNFLERLYVFAREIIKNIFD